MKTKATLIGSLTILFLTMTSIKNNKYDEIFIVGTPEIESMDKLSFGPDGTLFIGDSKNAAIFAMHTEDTEHNEKSAEVNISGFDKRLAEALGMDVAEINIRDMAVNPISKTVYFSVHTGNGIPLLLTLKDEKISAVSLENVKYAKVNINNPVDENKKDRHGNSQRVLAISDLEFHDGKVMVSGLSNKEFSSTFRSIPFPFKKDQSQASLEIYHAAHGKFETYAPIKTFTVANINGASHLMASYTCTPLVLFPLNELNDGKHVKGRTVAELGNWNSPIDIISMTKDGENYFLMANTNRPVMKIKESDLNNFKGGLTEQVKYTAGVEHVSLPMVNVLQLDKLDNDQFLVLQRQSDGDLVLRTHNNRWL